MARLRPGVLAPTQGRRFDRNLLDEAPAVQSEVLRFPSLLRGSFNGRVAGERVEKSDRGGAPEFGK